MKFLNQLAAFTFTSFCILGISFPASADDFTGQQYGLPTEGGAVNMPSISDLIAPDSYSTGNFVDLILVVYPGQSNCSSGVDNCEFIGFGKLKGTVGNFNGQIGNASAPSVTYNYAGHFYSYNRCTDKCRHYQVNFNGNIPNGRNTYEITYANNTWYLLLDGKYIQDLPQFGQLKTAQAIVYGIERHLDIGNVANFNFNSGIQDTNVTIKDTSGIYRTVSGNLRNIDDSITGGFRSSFDNKGTITFTHSN